MTYTVDLAASEHSPTVWPLKRLTRTDMVSTVSTIDFASSGDCELQLDRGNADFGLLYPLEDSTSIMAQADNDEPIHFKASWVLAVCSRTNGQGGAALKVCLQLPNYQMNLEFEDINDAQCFVVGLKALATSASTFYEAPAVNVFMKDNFRITQLPAYCAQPNFVWSMAVHPMIEMSRLWKADDISDFVVTAGRTSFKVHRVVLCLRSQFFKNACKPGFVESTAGCIQLEEDATTVEALLMEIYGVQNTNTGSVFTTFALEPTIKKEATMTTLLLLFVAADKIQYGLDNIKHRAACAFLDRLPFMHDVDLIMELANFTLDSMPERDCGLRASIIRYVQARLPAIMRSPEAEEELMQNAIVCLAVLRNFSRMIEEGALVVNTKSNSGLLTPPPSPVKRKRFA
ncbi:hypothetical protein SLS60_009954 [Paraconiothyrium brasiliense]|uniref:BTB domain-containing protein n=1 Tax=Paraconiothyrium brasiliense TaxID=300254 RepID=A0ABR3QSX9_9PLEO